MASHCCHGLNQPQHYPHILVLERLFQINIIAYLHYMLYQSCIIIRKHKRGPLLTHWPMQGKPKTPAIHEPHCHYGPVHQSPGKRMQRLGAVYTELHSGLEKLRFDLGNSERLYCRFCIFAMSAVVTRVVVFVIIIAATRSSSMSPSMSPTQAPAAPALENR